MFHHTYTRTHIPMNKLKKKQKDQAIGVRSHGPQFIIIERGQTGILFYFIGKGTGYCAASHVTNYGDNF